MEKRHPQLDTLLPSSQPAVRQRDEGANRRTSCKRTQAEVADLQPLVTDAAIVTHMMTMTMVDGKTVNVATGTASTQRCSMCGLDLQELSTTLKL